MPALDGIADIPDALAETMTRRLIEFVAVVRDDGFGVGVQEAMDALRVARHCSMFECERLRWGLRSLMCGNPREWERFDDLFDAYWLPGNRQARVRSSSSAGAALDQSGGAVGSGGNLTEADIARRGDGGAAGEGGTRGGASWEDSRAHADFRFLLDQVELRAMEQLVERLARRMRRRLVRRMRIQQEGRRIHLRRTFRNSLRYGGTPLELVFRNRRRQLPRLVLLIDVSRSMSVYGYLFLRFVHGLVGAFRNAEAYVFHTRLVHVSEALRGRDVQKVREKLAVLSLGWSGGTRIGECLQAFNTEYGRRILNSRSVVFILSDGLDTGIPTLLGRQLAEIKRCSRKVVWLNPLLGREGYEPIAAGMQAALPSIDLFAPAHSLASLAALERHLISL